MVANKTALTLLTVLLIAFATVGFASDQKAVTIEVNPSSAATVATTGTDSRLAQLRHTADQKALEKAYRSHKSYVASAPDPNDPTYWKRKNTTTVSPQPTTSDSAAQQTPEQIEKKRNYLQKILSAMNKNNDGATFHAVAFTSSTTRRHVQTGMQSAAIKTALALPGTLWYATMATGADSYVPGPVMATLQQGPFAGANVLGKFQVAPDGEHLILLFSQMAFQGRTYPVSAVAMDPNTRITGVTGEIDHHIWTRFILPGAATFLEKITDALTSEDQSTSISPSGIVVTRPKLTSRQLGLIGAGGATKAFAEATKPTGVLRLPEVRIAAKQGIGFLLLKPIV